MRRLFVALVVLAAWTGCALAAPSLDPRASDPRPREIMNGAELELALRKLQVMGSALFIAAHPDDENSALLAYLSRERKVRAAYLSITRGDGGQNLLGTETGEALGVIRTQELMAARRIDGAEQFFTRALDFGFSKNPEESLEIWDHDAILADVVWVIRRYRPDVIVTRFGTDGSGGHGHHTASAILAGEAFRAAGDATRFPEQLRDGVATWRPKRILWNSWAPKMEGRDPARPRLLTLDLGRYSPLLGRAYSEIAGQSRSMHKSQGFGAPERRGTILNYFEHVDGEPATADLFDGVDLSWNRVKNGARVEKLLKEAERTFDPDHPAAILPTLVKAQAEMAALESDPLVETKRRDLIEVIRSCAGLWVETTAARPSATPGSKLPVSVSVLNRSDAKIALLGVELPYGAAPRLSTGAGADSGKSAAGVQLPLAPNARVAVDAMVSLPADLPLTQPYWLRERRLPGAFRVDDQNARGVPADPAALTARVTLSIAGERVVFDSPVVHRWVDPVQGERYRLLEIAPPVTSRFDQSVYLFADAKPHEVRLMVESADTTLAGTARLVLPAGWRAEPESAPVQTSKGTQELRFRITPAEGPAAATMSAAIEVGGRRYTTGMQRIDYPHLPIQTLFPPAEARLVRADVKHTGDQIGYLMGSGDQVPDALRQMGFRVTLLSDEDVEQSDLSRFGAIVTGVRAYNTRPRLLSLQSRLFDYVADGGRLVVQYNTADDAVKEKLGPYPFTISRDRVTVEGAEMRMLQPEHRLLTSPNRITAQDFEGWVQERGLYYANPWDSHYEPIFSANDPGEKPKDGGLLYARHGKGVFIYTGLAWFRQLPAGVPGAYRLFANLVSTVPGS